MITALACVLTAGVLLYILGVRQKDLPEPQPVSPFQHLDERKAAIYENLRDLQFEYRVGKLSDADYQQTKKDLQKELAQVLAEVDRLREQLGQLGAKPAKAAAAANPIKPAPVSNKFACPSCNATFDKDLKFCGECGKPMRKAEA
jgi:NADH pyrophosphatase NudC (nudix superfamily)